MVDLADLSALLTCFGGDVCGDVNDDNVVDLSDLANLLSVFGMDCE